MLAKKQKTSVSSGTWLTNLQALTLSTILCIILGAALSGCGGLGYVPPPGAKLGDAFLSLTISTKDRFRMPQGADIVITIEDPMATTPVDSAKKDPKFEPGVIIGDVVKLSQPDSDVKVNFPIDRNRLAECGKSKTCYLRVKVVKNGTVRYKSTTPGIYNAGQTKASITISKAT